MEDKFYLLANQNANTSFERVFLFDQVAFAVDSNGNLWVLGGKLAYANEEIFSMEYGLDMYEAPQKTNLYQAVKAMLQLEDSVRVKVTDVNYTPKLILITVETTK